MLFGVPASLFCSSSSDFFFCLGGSTMLVFCSSFFRFSVRSGVSSKLTCFCGFLCGERLWLRGSGVCSRGGSSGAGCCLGMKSLLRDLSCGSSVVVVAAPAPGGCGGGAGADGACIDDGSVIVVSLCCCCGCSCAGSVGVFQPGVKTGSVGICGAGADGGGLGGDG